MSRRLEGVEDPELLPTRYFVAPWERLDEVVEIDDQRLERLQPGG